MNPDEINFYFLGHINSKSIICKYILAEFIILFIVIINYIVIISIY